MCQPYRCYVKWSQIPSPTTHCEPSVCWQTSGRDPRKPIDMISAADNESKSWVALTKDTVELRFTYQRALVRAFSASPILYFRVVDLFQVIHPSFCMLTWSDFPTISRVRGSNVRLRILFCTWLVLSLQYHDCLRSGDYQGRFRRPPHQDVHHIVIGRWNRSRFWRSFILWVSCFFWPWAVTSKLAGGEIWFELVLRMSKKAVSKGEIHLT